MSLEIFKKSPDSILWQDYRSFNKGMIVYYSSDPVSEIPIREVPEDEESPPMPDPNYETGTYGFYSCYHSKIRAAFTKNKLRYLFFLTKYAGMNKEAQGKSIITGYFRIKKTANVQKLHLRYLDEYSCTDLDECFALKADEIHFVSLKDAFEVNDELLKKWGYKAKISKQMRIILDEENTNNLLSFLSSKPNDLENYIKETKRLSPYQQEEIEEEAEEEILQQQSNIMPNNEEIKVDNNISQT